MDNHFQTLAQASKGITDNHHVLQDIRVQNFREIKIQKVYLTGLICSKKQVNFSEKDLNIECFIM